MSTRVSSGNGLEEMGADTHPDSVTADDRGHRVRHRDSGEVRRPSKPDRSRGSIVAGWIASSTPAGGEPQTGRLLVGVLGAVLGGVLASLVGVGSPATFVSVGAWVVALSGAATLLLIQSRLGSRSAQRRSPPVH